MIVKRLLLFTLIFLGYSFTLSAQKSKVIGTIQLIENEKYDEAKGILEEAIKKKSSKNWPRTWYARGILCQNAYKKGIDKKDENLYKMYNDQLYVAYSSFEKARTLDKHGHLDKHLRPRYVILANQFMKLGESKYASQEYDESFRAYEYALKINRSSFMSMTPDTNLIYNAALSAYKSKKWTDALAYLSELNENEYSSNVPHLMFSIHMMQADTAAAQSVLMNGIQNYDDNEELILLLVDLLYKKNDADSAVNVLNEAFQNDSTNFTYPYTIGLLYQKMEEYNKAIESYKVALTVSCDTAKIYSSIGTCYFNLGAEIDKRARTITNNAKYLEEKEMAAKAFEASVEWFEQAYQYENKNQDVISKLKQLYMVLDNKQKLIDLK